MKLNIFVIFLLLILFSQDLLAQRPIRLRKRKVDVNSPEAIAQREIREGDRTYNMKGLALSLALEHYLKAYDYDANNPMLNYKIGVCYLNTINKVKSIPYLEKAYRIRPNINRDIRYLLGLAYQLNCEWDKAIREFEKFQQSLTPDLKEALGADVIKHIEECKTGKLLMEKPVNVKIENIGSKANSIFPEYAPFLTVDEGTMFFTARKDNTTGGYVDYLDYEYFEDLYVSSKENGEWGIPSNLGSPINLDSHDATAGLSSDGQILFVYRGEVRGGDIFESRLQGSIWSKPVSLGKNINTKYHESSVCLSANGKTLYFVSDRPDMGFGGRDVYMSRLDSKGRWGKPINLGSVINTPYDEDGIFLHADGKTLFFSSKGHETMGGYDIFWTKYNDSTKSWSKPVNIGYPVNTPDDDVFFVLSANGDHGYYSSVKNGGYGEKDIYMISFLDNNKVEADTLRYEEYINPLTLLKGRVLDSKTRMPIAANIEMVDNFRSLSINMVNSNSQTGKFMVALTDARDYGIYVTAPGYLFHSENIDIHRSKVYQEIEIEVLLDKIEVGEKIVLNNIFYDFDKSTLRSESTFELKQLLKIMNDYPTIKIEIASHTDNFGSDEYNYKLSDARAKSVVDWLAKNGVDISRLKFKGYGESQPAATNETPEGRQLNRRTEFRILSK